MKNTKGVIFFCLNIFLTMSACSIIEEGDKGIIDKIHSANHNSKTSTLDAKLRVVPHVYIDYSDGMQLALNEASDFFYDVLDIVDLKTTKYYRVGQTSNPIAMTKEELDEKFNPRRPKSFSDKRSELDIALRKITTKNNFAVFITDFELVKTGKSSSQRTSSGKIVNTYISLDNWALDEFDEWFSEGNSLEIYAHEFRKNTSSSINDKSQYLYFLIFIPNEYLKKEKVIDIRNRLQKEGGNLKKIYFSKNDYSIEGNKKKKGGMPSILEPESFIIAEEYEYYQIAFDDFMDYVVLDDIMENKLLIGGLQFFNNTIFSDLIFELKIYDITDLYEGALGEEANPHSFFAQEARVVQNKFVLKQSNDSLGIELHPTYNMLENDRAFYMAKIYLKKGKNNINESMLKTYLSWNDAKGGFPVNGLYGSLNEASKRMKLESNHVFTFYIDLISK